MSMYLSCNYDKHCWRYWPGPEPETTCNTGKIRIIKPLTERLEHGDLRCSIHCKNGLNLGLDFFVQTILTHIDAPWTFQQWL